MTKPAKVPETSIVVSGRLSFCFPFDPKEGKYGAKYRTDVLIPKEEIQVGGFKFGGPDAIKAIRKAFLAAKKRKWGENEDNHPKLKSDRTCLRDGDAVYFDEDGEELPVPEEKKGHWIISCSSENQPEALDLDGKTVLFKKDGKCYSGAYGRVLMNIWAQDRKPDEGGKRLNSDFLGVGHLAHGERFGEARVSASDMFGSLEDEGESGFGESDDDELAF